MGGKGSGGHNKKTVADLKLAGTFRPDRHGAKLAPLDIKHPPTWLAGRALEFWRLFAPRLAKDGWLTATDVPDFAVLCGLVAVTEDAWDVYQETGQGHALALIATKECRAWLAKFGISYYAEAWQKVPES